MRRGYNGNELLDTCEVRDDLEDWESEEYEELEGEEEEEEEEEEEDRKPTIEEVKYLELRQKLKDAVRKQMKKDSGASNGNSLERKRKLPYDNYGSFFGPSQPVIAQRVIQESKSLLETQHLASRVSNSHHGLQSKNPAASTALGSRPGVRAPPPKVMTEGKSKAQKLKDMRDYSFLSSEDAELPAPTKEPPRRNASLPNCDARSAQMPSKNKQSTSNPSRPVLSSREDRKYFPTNRQVQTLPGARKVVPTSRPNLSTDDPRRHLGSNAGNGPGRPNLSTADPRRHLGSNVGNGPGRPNLSTDDPRRHLGSNAGNGPGRPNLSTADPRRHLGSNAGNGPGRPNLSTADPRRHLGSNAGNGPGRPNLSTADPRRHLGSNAGNGPGRPNLSTADPRRHLGSNAGNGPGRPHLSTADPRRHLSSNAGTEPGRPIVSKGLTTKISAPTRAPTSLKTQLPTLDKKASSMGLKKPVPAVQRAPSSKLISSVNKQHLDQRRDFREPEKAKVVSKQLVSSSKPQMKPPKQMPPRPSVPVNRPKKRPIERYSDEDEDEDTNAIREIRKMFRYNPKRYAGDDEDDSDMEANFDDIQREELHSSKIAREEDEIELRRNEEEEKQERLRKQAKRRKLSQR